MNNATRRFLLSGLSFAALLVSGAVTAQDAAAPMEKFPVADCNFCPNPVSVNIVKNSGATSPDPADFLPTHLNNNVGYNSTQANRFFAETIRWRMPAARVCELKGTLTYTLRNVANSGLQNNDLAVVLTAGGTQVAGSRQSITLAAGQSQTYTYTMTSAQIRSGKISLFVQDDTSVTNVRVNIRGCCINPN